MLKRKITSELLKWKRNKDKLCLLVRGARQVGKTFSIDQFAREQYRHYIDINFEENPAYKAIFAGDLDVNTLIKQISLRVPDAQIVPGQTLLFLDEIQSCPAARTALKFLAQDRRIDVIASGSLLGLNYKEVSSYPVGYVETLEMYSLDFEEFLWGNGVAPQSIADVQECFAARRPVPAAMHARMLELFREHVAVGGMPRAVSVFSKTHNFAEVLKIQKNIINDYAEDIIKYAPGSEKTKARACFFSIPKHLSKEYKKFQYSLVEPRGTARRFGGSLLWLYDAGIVNFCHNLTAPELPLEGQARSDMFKVYMRDTGLLTAMLEDGAQQNIIDGDLGVYKGALYENIIADIFGKQGKKLYYFERNSKLEIDFFIHRNGQATAVEVKAADNTKSKSLNSVLENYGVTSGIKLSAKNIGGSGRIDSYPLYMALFL